MRSKEYKVIIEKDEDGIYVGSVPALPGCYTQAESIEVLNIRLKEVISMCEAEYKTNKEYKSVVKI